MYGGLLLSSSRWSVVRHGRKHDEGADASYEANDRSQDECEQDPCPIPRAEVLSISVHALSLANLLFHEKYSVMRRFPLFLRWKTPTKGHQESWRTFDANATTEQSPQQTPFFRQESQPCFAVGGYPNIGLALMTGFYLQ